MELFGENFERFEVEEEAPSTSAPAAPSSGAQDKAKKGKIVARNRVFYIEYKMKSKQFGV